MKSRTIEVVAILILITVGSWHVNAQSSSCTFFADSYTIYETPSIYSSSGRGTSTRTIVFSYGEIWQHIWGVGYVRKNEGSCVPVVVGLGGPGGSNPGSGSGGWGGGGGSPCGRVLLDTHIVNFDDNFSYTITSPSERIAEGEYFFGLSSNSNELETYNLNPDQLIVLDTNDGGFWGQISNEALFEAEIFEPFTYDLDRIGELSREEQDIIEGLPAEFKRQVDLSNHSTTPNNDIDPVRLFPTLVPVFPDLIPPLPDPDGEDVNPVGIVCMPSDPSGYADFPELDFEPGGVWFMQIHSGSNDLVTEIEFTLTEAGVAGLLANR